MVALLAALQRRVGGAWQAAWAATVRICKRNAVGRRFAR